MLGRRVVPLVLLVLGCSALLAPATLAQPKATSSSHGLVTFRQCGGVLNAEDFSDELQEVTATVSVDNTESSTCKYGSLSESGPSASTKDFTNGGLGVECLANLIKIEGTEGTAPPGGCYRISEMTVFFITGSYAKKLLPKLEKGSKRRFWPAGFTRRTLPGVGTRAEYGYDGTKGFGYLQVVNATVTVETDEIENMPRLLKEAASSL